MDVGWYAARDIRTALQIEVMAYALAVLVLAFHPRKWTAVIFLSTSSLDC